MKSEFSCPSCGGRCEFHKWTKEHGFALYSRQCNPECELSQTQLETAFDNECERIFVRREASKLA